MENYLPFDDIMPTYNKWWATYRPKKARFARILFRDGISRWDTDFNKQKFLTIFDICNMIEDGSILTNTRNFGKYSVCQHIETFFKYGLVDKKWHEKYLGVYS